MKNIGFITSTEDPSLIKDDQLAIKPLRQLGYLVEPCVWDKDETDLKNFDALIFRSCWNYHRKYEKFLKWMEALEKIEIPILNPIEVSLWNLNKKYLLDLARKGAAIPKSEWISKETKIDSKALKNLIEKMNSDQIVIKPAISLNGEDTYLTSANRLTEVKNILEKLPRNRDVLIQEFIPEIKTSGEVSLIFFNNEFSHAIRKTPASNEFRIHSEYGGKQESINPNSDLIHQAQMIINMVDIPLLFSRVDVVEREKDAILIELEIIDPMLFLGYSERAPERFADAIRASLMHYCP